VSLWLARRKRANMIKVIKMLMISIIAAFTVI